jgi:hypothetical protein
MALEQDDQFEDGDSEWNRERRTRTILAEEIQGLLTAHVPGLGAADKQRKAALLFEVFNTRSWTAVENLPSQTLRHGLAVLREKLEGAKPAAETEPVDTSGPWDEGPGPV